MIRAICGSMILATSFGLPLLAKCPLADGSTVIVRSTAGNLHVDTKGREATAEVQVENNAVQVQENCGKQTVEFTAVVPDPIKGTTDWKIIVPKAVHLDLVTMAGSIDVGDVDGNVVLRTAGGSVTTGNIRGKAAIISQGGFIRAGNIGGDAELRSQGGTLEVGDIGGNAEFNTSAGIIKAGNITGSVNAVGGQTITIVKAGEVKATTSGDISIGDASRINAQSGGGNITSKRVRGPFQGRTESGDIRLDSAASWVEAYTGRGNIFVRLVPENIDSDLHMNLESGVGDVTVYLPPRLRASIDASVQRPALQAQQIISEFPSLPSRPPQGLIPNRFYAGTRSESVLNGGGNKIVLHTALGKITIRMN